MQGLLKSRASGGKLESPGCRLEAPGANLYQFIGDTYRGSPGEMRATFLMTASVGYLNKILSLERANFAGVQSDDFILSKESQAKYDVDIYVVKYDSEIFDSGPRPTVAYGLIAVP